MIERKTVPGLQVKASGEGGFEGLGACFHNVDDSVWPDVLAPGCFKADLDSFLAEGFIGGVNHDWDTPIGKPVEARETPEGLWLRATISDTAAGRDTRTLLQDGVIRKLSIGFRVLEKRWLETAEEVRSWWDSQGYAPTPEDLTKSATGVRLVTRAKLYEVSPVAVPANGRAVITAVKDAQQRGGTTFSEHTTRALAALEDWIERLDGLKGKREAEGRGLSPDHQMLLKRLRSRLDTLLLEPDPEARTQAGLAADGILTRLKGLGL